MRSLSLWVLVKIWAQLVRPLLENQPARAFGGPLWRQKLPFTQVDFGPMLRTLDGGTSLQSQVSAGYGHYVKGFGGYGPLEMGNWMDIVIIEQVLGGNGHSIVGLSWVVLFHIQSIRLISRNWKASLYVPSAEKKLRVLNLLIESTQRKWCL